MAVEARSHREFPIRQSFVLLIAAGFVVAIVTTVTLLFRSSTDEAQSQPGESARSLPSIQAGRGIHAPVIGVNDEAVTEKGGNAVVTIIDPTSGSILGQLEGGYNAWVLTRRTHNQVLIAQASGPGLEYNEPTLMIYDLAQPIKPPVVIPLPARATSTLYTPGMLLSADEGILYYAGRRNLCTDGNPGAGPACDGVFVGIIDLEGNRHVADATLPIGCSFPQLMRDGTTDALAICRAGSFVLTKISSQGQATPLASVPHDSNVAFAGVDADGKAYVGFTDGTVVDSNGDTLSSSPTPLAFNGAIPLDDENWILASGSLRPDAFASVTVASRADPLSRREYQLPFVAIGISVVDSSHVALLHEDGQTVSALDLLSGDISTGSSKFPEDTKWLAP